MDIFMRICTQNSDKHQCDKYLREEGVCYILFLFFYNCALAIEKRQAVSHDLWLRN